MKKKTLANRPMPPPPPPFKSEDFPAFFMERTSFLLHRTGVGMIVEFANALAPLRIRPHHFAVMAIISTGKPPSQIEVGAKVRFDRNKMVNVIDELEELGLARREANPNDRRAKAVCLTERGRATFETALKLETAVEAKCLSALSAQQRREFHQLLKTIVAAQGK